MTTPPPAHGPTSIAASPPRDAAAPATMDWVVAVTDAHVLTVDRTTEPAVMAAAWGLALVGASRLEVWWVLQDERLCRAYGSIIRAVGKVRPHLSPSWTDVVEAMPPSDRAQLAEQAEELITRGTTGVPATSTELYAACRHHPDAVLAPGRRWIQVPEGALAELRARARSLSPADIDELLERARRPFAQRMAEADRVSGNAVATFDVRRRHRVA